MIMPRYLIELQLTSETRADFARLMRVIRSARLRIENDTAKPRVGAIGLVSNGPRTYCVVHAGSAEPVEKLIQAAMLPGRILRITELDPTTR